MGVMTTSPDAVPEYSFRPRSSQAVALAVIILGLGGAVAIVIADGVAALPLTAPLVLVAYLGWLLFWFPKVVLDGEGVTLVNPLQTLRISWHSIILVEAKYAATILTPHGSYTAWAAPAPGMFGALRDARSADAANRSTESGRQYKSMRAGEVPGTASGSVVQRIRQVLDRRAEAEVNDIELTESLRVVRRFHWLHLSVLLFLILAAVAVPLLIS